MEKVAPLGGDLSGRALSGKSPGHRRRGSETLTLLRAPGVYAELETKGKRLDEGWRGCGSLRIPVQVNRVGSLLTVSSPAPRMDYATAKTADARRYGVFFGAMLERA